MMTLEDKWIVVKEFYEGPYKLRFSARPSDLQIQELYNQMRKLTGSMYEHWEKNPILLKNFKAKNGIV